MRIRQIYYKNDHIPHLDPLFSPLYNEKANEFLENQVILNLYKEKDYQNSDYYGVLSWKFSKKVPLDGITMEIMMEREDQDVFLFNRRTVLGAGNSQHSSVWSYADRWHKYFSKIGNILSDRLDWGFDVTKIKTPICYYNYFVAKEYVFKGYVRDMLEPVMEVMSNKEDTELQSLLWTNAEYRSSDNLQLNEEGCMRVFGVPFYPYHPFICERLMSTYIVKKELNYKHLN